MFKLLPQTIRNVVDNRWTPAYSHNQNQNGYNYQNPNNYQSGNYQYQDPNPNTIPNYQISNYHSQSPNFNNQEPTSNYQNPVINNQEPSSNNQNTNFNSQYLYFSNQESTPNYQNNNFNNQGTNINNQESTSNYQNPNINNPGPNSNNENTNLNSQYSYFNNQELLSNYQNPNFNNQNSNLNNQEPNPNNLSPNFNNENPNFDVRLTEFTTAQGNLLSSINGDEEAPFIFPDDDNGPQGNTGSENISDDVDNEPQGNGGPVNIGDDVVRVVETAEEQVTPSTQPTIPGGLIRITPSFENRNMLFNVNSDSCRTIDNTPGQCITLLLCPEYLNLLKQGQNPAVVNILRRAHCGFDGNTPKVCCPPRGFETGPTFPVTPPVTPAPVTEAPARPKSNDEVYVNDLPDPPVCGVSNGAFSRIVRGVPAKLGQFPWIALLGYRGRRDPNTPRWLCGGSLISSKHVLTAAHCIHGRENDLYQVRLGELDLASETEGATPIDVPITRKIKHEDYSPTAFSNDIGILVLGRIIKFTDLIKPICMPRSPNLRSITFERYSPLIAGWGDIEFRGKPATHLQMTQLPVVPNEKCARAYSAYKNQVIDHKVLCAGFDEGGTDACQGDSGGPLMQPIFNGSYSNFYQIGVVSYGKKCAEPGFPGVYSRITYFVPWIEEKVIGRSRK